MNILLSSNLPDRFPSPHRRAAPRPSSHPPPALRRPSATVLSESPAEPRCINHSVHGHYGQNQRYPLSFIPTRLRNIFCAPDGNTAFIRQVIPMYTCSTCDGVERLSVYSSSLLDNSSEHEIPRRNENIRIVLSRTHIYIRCLRTGVL